VEGQAGSLPLSICETRLPKTGDRPPRGSGCRTRSRAISREYAPRRHDPINPGFPRHVVAFALACRLSFQGTANGKEYTTELEFFAEVDPEDKGSKYDIKPRNIHFHIVKKDKDAEYWPRLLKDKAKEKNQVAIDWTRYVDEDEEKGGFDTSAMGAGMVRWMTSG
jgi:hypothetical protein